MKVSQEGFEFLKKHEAVKNHVYKDVAGKDTIGVGHLLTRSELSSGKISILGKSVKYKDGLTDQQVDDLFKQDLIPREKIVESYVRVPLMQNQFDALVSFVFNVGRGAFGQSTLLKVLNQGKYDEVPAQLRRWIYSGGKKIDGLINRREAEIELWNKKKELNPVIV